MIAVDTNVLVRVVTGDPPDEARLAASAIKSAKAFVSLTVALELEWVLRSRYKFGRDAIVSTYARLLETEDIEFEMPERVAAAVDGLAAGMDFADALHLSSSPGEIEWFITFDTDFLARAPRNFERPVVSSPMEAVGRGS